MKNSMRNFFPSFYRTKIASVHRSFLTKGLAKIEVCTVFCLLSSLIVLSSSQLIIENVALTIINNYRQKTIGKKTR